jgi:hypothetical protein
MKGLQVTKQVRSYKKGTQIRKRYKVKKKGTKLRKRYEVTKKDTEKVRRYENGTKMLGNKLRKTLVMKLPSYEIVTPPIGIIYYDV